MKRFLYFLMVGLAFTVLQVSTVEAQAEAPDTPPMAPPTMGAPGTPPMTPPPGGHHDGPPPGDSCMAVPAGPDRDACYSSKSGTMPPMTPPPGDHSAMSNLGAHCGEIQAKNEKKRMRKEVKCLRRALHEHKPTVKLRQTKDGLGGYGCGVKKTGSKPAQIACLRGILDAPSGKPGMAPGTR